MRLHYLLGATLVTVTMVGAGCMGGGNAVDQTNPRAVVEAVFAAAGSDDMSVLANLCEPSGENDSDTQYICDVGTGKAEAEIKDSFVANFKTGKVTGDPVIEGDKAIVAFTAGVAGEEEDESMQLIQVDGKWYLHSF